MIDLVSKYHDVLLEGLLVTLKLVLASAVLMVPLALLTTAGRISERRWIRWLAATYTDVFRSLPILVLLIVSYYGLGPYLEPYGITPFWIAAIALAVNEAAYLAEGYRGVLSSVSINQWRASISLGHTKAQALRHVIVPQVLPASLPQLSNALIFLIKSSALASLITIQELVAVSYKLLSLTFEAFQVFFLILLMYIALTTTVAYTLRAVERRLLRRYKIVAPPRSLEPPAALAMGTLR